MGLTCILTDSIAQFPQLGFAGKNDIRVIPYQVELNGEQKEDEKDLKISDLPPVLIHGFQPRLISPSPARFQEFFIHLSALYHEVIVILTSSGLTKAYENARLAAESIHGRVHITLIDSQTTSIGLGLLVQHAAEIIARGQPVTEVEHIIRSLIPHTYTMLCTPGMSYLHQAGFIDQSQAFVGEMLGLNPIFTLEEGQLSSVEKVRNMRGLVDFMQEFVLEFDQLYHIAFIQGHPSMTHEARIIREHAQSCFPQTPFSEININLPLAILTGPRSTGLVVMEKAENGHFSGNRQKA